MLALSPQMFSNFSWPTEDPITSPHPHNNILVSLELETQPSGTGLGSPLSSTQAPQLGSCDEVKQHLSNNDIGKTTSTTVKKLNHNASERDRRKRINELYSSLRSLLPATDHKKKLSIPSTISRVLNYIPELQKEVETLLEKKQALNLKIGGGRRKEIILHNNYYGGNQISSAELGPDRQSSFLAVSASRLGDREIVIQISTLKCIKSSIAQTLLGLDLEGLLLLNMSTFQSFQGRVFYNLHLQILHGIDHVANVERLREKLLSLYDN